MLENPNEDLLDVRHNFGKLRACCSSNAFHHSLKLKKKRPYGKDGFAMRHPTRRTEALRKSKTAKVWQILIDAALLGFAKTFAMLKKHAILIKASGFYLRD